MNPSAAPSPRVAVALERAEDDARTLPTFPREDGVRRSRRFAVGDPQAPIATFLAILDGHGLLGDSGRLAEDVELVSMGDHFDFGTKADRLEGAASGTRILAWLAAHAADQVTILAGNHDLARVGELARFDDAEFAAAQDEADEGYYARQPSRTELEFRARFGLPSWEIAARDFGCFRVEQRTLVTALLQTRRMRAAFAAAGDLLLTHAGVTHDQLEAAGLPPAARADARDATRALNDVLDAAVAGWTGGALAFPPFHAPGDASREGSGMFYHRPVRLDVTDPAAAAAPRRFDVHRLPVGLTQAIGHIRDGKCRELLGVALEGAEDGPLRSLRVTSDALRYGCGVPVANDPRAATVLFLDGGMQHVPPSDYELLDLSTRGAARR